MLTRIIYLTNTLTEEKLVRMIRELRSRKKESRKIALHILQSTEVVKKDTP